MITLGRLPDLTRVTIDGRVVEYGTAAEIAAHLGPDVTEDMVRNWGNRDGLRKVTVPGPGRGTVRYPLDQAAQIERDKRLATRGRRRCLDIMATLS